MLSPGSDTIHSHFIGQSQIAASKFKREENDNLTICFKEERDEITLSRVNDYDSQHRDYFFERKINNSVTLS